MFSNKRKIIIMNSKYNVYWTIYFLNIDIVTC